MTGYRLLRAADRRAEPWKNSGGVTREVAACRAEAEAGTGDFDWRVSVAEVAAPGPFSCFTNVDRVLTIIRGDLHLEFESDRPSTTLTERSAPHAFPGDLPTFGTPVSGVAHDLNVMVRRGRWAGTVTRLTAADSVSIDSGSDMTLLLFGGDGSVRCDGALLAMQPLGAFILEEAGDRATSVASRGTVYAVQLSRVDARRPR